MSKPVCGVCGDKGTVGFGSISIDGGPTPPHTCSSCVAFDIALDIGNKDVIAHFIPSINARRKANGLKEFSL